MDSQNRIKWTLPLDFTLKASLLTSYFHVGDFGVGGYAFLPMKSKYSSVARTTFTKQGWTEGQTYGIINRRQIFFKSWDIQRWNSICLTIAGGVLNVFMNGEKQKLTSDISDVEVPDENLKIFGFNLIGGQERKEWKSFQGSITDLHAWKSILPDSGIAQFAACSLDQPGDLLDWAAARWAGQGVEQEDGETDTVCPQEVSLHLADQHSDLLPQESGRF